MSRRSNVIHLPRARKDAEDVVTRRMLKRKGAVSFPQLRQRELAWILYISEGFIANAEHALRVNCVTFDNQDHDAVAELISAVKETTELVRQRLSTIEQE